MRTPRLQTMLVDIDGTLVLSNAAHAAAWSLALRAHGFELSPEDVRPRIGMGGDKILAGLHPNLDPASAIAREIKRDRKKIFLDEYLPSIMPTPGARALVQSLHDFGVRVVVATSAEDDERDALLDVAHVSQYIEAPPAKAKRGKPEPDVVLAALDRAGSSPREACMIGDTPYDVEAATRAGVRIIAVRCGGWDDSSLSQAAAVYADPADALDHLSEWS